MKRTAKAAIAVVALVGGLSLAQAAWAAENKYVIDFETRFGVGGDSKGVITAAKGMVISGAKSFLCDSTKSADEWNERFYTDTTKVKLEPNASYTIDFDYKITTPEDDGGFFYFFLRLTGDNWAGHDQGWTQWTAADGDEGHKSISVDLEDFTNYRIVFGLHNKGGMVIDNLVIEKN